MPIHLVIPRSFDVSPRNDDEFDDDIELIDDEEADADFDLYSDLAPPAQD
jgi:hypothetical protein